MRDLQNRVLLVDDDAAIVRAYTTALTAHGWLVDAAFDGRQAVERLGRGAFDVIVCDVVMPHMGGLEFLKAVREHDLDVPVILMAGVPELDSALRAVEHGAFRYLSKPVELHVLEETVDLAARLHTLAKLKRQAFQVVGEERRRMGDRAGLEARFEMALKLLWMAYQPVVSLSSQTVYGYEALLRSYEPTLRSATELLGAAESLGRMTELGRAVRARVARDAAEVPEGTKLFVNVHALELADDQLYASDTPLARFAGNAVVEITERASLEGLDDVLGRVATLRARGYQIAVDDLGAGYAGLTTFEQLQPDIAKLDMSLIRDIHVGFRRQSIVRSMIELCNELGTRVVAEGIETAEERDTLTDLGCDLVQGFLFGHPENGFRPPVW